MSDEFMFRDAEPEDAWDASDPVEDLLENLRRRLDILELVDNPIMQQLEDIRRRLGRIRAKPLTRSETLRANLIAADVETLLGRLEDEDPLWAPPC